MFISEIETKRLLPDWAHGVDWIEAAFDVLVKASFARIPVIGCPLSMDSIRTLTDAELREWYARYGVVEYYPELSRETRENLLYWLCRLYRYLGTPEAVHVLCDYIFDGAPLGVTVADNLAFDESGTLVDASLLNLFDIYINAESPSISMAQYGRIVRNVLSIARNSQALRDVYIVYGSEIDVPCAVCDYGCTVYRVGDDDECAAAPDYSADLMFVSTETGEITFGADVVEIVDGGPVVANVVDVSGDVVFVETE